MSPGSHSYLGDTKLTGSEARDSDSCAIPLLRNRQARRGQEAGSQRARGQKMFPEVDPWEAVRMNCLQDLPCWEARGPCESIVASHPPQATHGGQDNT